METKKIKYIDTIRGIAILSVICAHCNTVVNLNDVRQIICSRILSNIGTAGVLCFFFLSGMLFHYEGDLCKFWKKKLIKLFPVWILSASVIYLYVYLRKSSLSLKSWFNYIIGNGSYCYYITMLFAIYVCFTIFRFLGKKNYLRILVIITAISTLSFSKLGIISPYLNILNWIGYFALGKLVGIENFEKYGKYIIENGLKYICIGIYIGLLIFQILHNSSGGYWGGINTIVAWCGAMLVVLCGLHLSKYDNKIILYIEQAGEQSLFIYLWHMPVAGIVRWLMNINSIMNLILLRPVIILGIMILSVNFGKKILPDFIKRIVGLV